MKNIFMFDVESTDLYGKGFAFSVVVQDRKGQIIDSLTATVDLELVETECNAWVKENVLPAFKTFKMQTVSNYKDLRKLFYDFYMSHKENAIIFSDCNYPVETSFLAEIVKDDVNRQWDMPYPLYDVCNFVDIDIDRSEKYMADNSAYILQDVSKRKPQKHNPYWDCLTSLHCLRKNKVFRKWYRKL